MPCAKLSHARTRDGGAPVRSQREGYVSSVHATRLVQAAAACDGTIVQRVQIGVYVTPELVLADVWCADDRRDALVAAVRESFVLGRRRTPVQDGAFALRLLVLLERIEDAARAGGLPCVEPSRQAALIVEGAAGALPTATDVDALRAEHAALWPRSGARPLRDGRWHGHVGEPAATASARRDRPRAS